MYRIIPRIRCFCKRWWRFKLICIPSDLPLHIQEDLRNGMIGIASFSRQANDHTRAGIMANLRRVERGVKFLLNRNEVR